MNIILVTAAEVIDQQILLDDHRAAHIIKILQSEVGDSVRIGIIDGGKGTGLVVEICKKRPFYVRLAVQISDCAIVPVPEIDLILALPRPIMLKRILTQVAALGIGRIFLIHANRVEKSYWEAGLLEEDQCREYLRQGLEQAIDTRMPQVEMHRRFKPFVEDVLPEISSGHLLRLLAHPDKHSNLAEVCAGGLGRILLAVGPEGGWLDFEVEMFQRQGFCCCSLGERILKVDTAVVALHAQITAMKEFLKGKTKRDCA